MPRHHHDADACDKTRMRLLHQRDQATQLARHAARIASLALGRLHRYDPETAMRLHRALGRPATTPMPQTRRRRDLTSEITAWLTQHPDQWATARMVARAIHANDGNVRYALGALHDRGLVEQRDIPGRGRGHEWRIATPPQEAT